VPGELLEINESGERANETNKGLIRINNLDRFGFGFGLTKTFSISILNW
jgi:hypothetical protein